MAKYVYPAIFKKENDVYSITFPDLPDCFTQGDDLQDGLENAQDALCLMLYHKEKDNKTIASATDIKDIKVDKDSFVTLISCDTWEYEKYYKSKSVKKTLTIPEWLNDMAIDENVNFSNVLQNALMEELNIRQ